MPDIAIISNSAFSLVNFRSHFIKALADSGHKVFALAPDYIPKFRNRIKEVEAEPVDIYMDRTGQNAIKDIGAVYSIFKTLGKLKPEITFSYGIKPVIYGLWASRMADISQQYAMVAGLGTVYVDREDVSVGDRATRKIADFLYRSSLKFADKVFFQNPDDIRLFAEKGIVDVWQAELINGSGVDTDHYRPSEVQKDPLTFTLASRLIKEKGIYEFIAAARQLKSRYPEKDIDFILLGDVDANPNSIEESELETWVDEGVIKWPGHVDDVKRWLERTSVFVLPTYYREGIPKSILEAMSMKLPIITTDMPGCREAVTDGENGFLIPPQNPSVLTDSMAEIIENPSLLEPMGSASRKKAVDKYDVRKVNNRLLSEMGLLDTVAEKQTRY